MGVLSLSEKGASWYSVTMKIIPFSPSNTPLAGQETRNALKMIKATKQVVSEKLDAIKELDSQPLDTAPDIGKIKIDVPAGLGSEGISGKAEFNEDGTADSMQITTGEGNSQQEYHYQTLPNGGKLYAAPTSATKEWGMDHFVMVENTDGTIHIGGGTAGGPLHFGITDTKDRAYGRRHMYS